MLSQAWQRACKVCDNDSEHGGNEGAVDPPSYSRPPPPLPMDRARRVAQEGLGCCEVRSCLQ